MSTITEIETTPQAIEELAGRIFMEGVGAFHLGTVYIGLKHGLFAALVEDDGTAARIAAARASLRYAPGWTAGTCVSGFKLKQPPGCCWPTMTT